MKRWENGIEKWDFQEETRKANAFLGEFGRDKLSYKVETGILANEFWRYNEARLSHGYPATFYLQAAICYGCGLYTAKQQGIMRKGVYFQRFWKHHYFDWIMFGQRSLKYGVIGGLLAGTVVFGSSEIALRRIRSKYDVYFAMPVSDIHDSEASWDPKLNG